MKLSQIFAILGIICFGASLILLGLQHFVEAGGMFLCSICCFCIRKCEAKLEEPDQE
jgi:hypothetical protein